MDNKSRQRKFNSFNRQNKEPLKFNLDINFLTLCCSYALSENTSIHPSAMSNLLKMIQSIDPSQFSSNQSLLQRYTFCQDALIIRIRDKIVNRDLLLKSVIGLVGNKYPDLDINSFTEISDNQISWLEKSVGYILDSMYINNNVFELNQVCQNYITSDINDKQREAKVLKETVSNMMNTFRQHDTDEDVADTEFLLSNPSQTIDNIIIRSKSPSYKLQTGMQCFNDILAGGFEGSRVYCLFGLPGEGKTTTLLNLLYQIKKNNPRYICKDKTKRPVIVLFTMENVVREAVTTLYNISTGTDDMTNFSTQEIIQKMAKGGLEVTPESPIDVYIKYKPVYSVDTNYLYTLTENLADKGMEVIAVVFDYIKRIRPVQDADKDERYRLGVVINELKSFASYKDIPVITASQLNRDGAKNVDALRESKKHDAINGVGRGNIGESSLIDENVDATLLLTPQEDLNGQKWMGFKITKTRYKISTNVTKFIHPFQKDNKVKLSEDLTLCSPLSRESLVSDKQVRNNVDNVRFQNTSASLSDIDSFLEESSIKNDIIDEDIPDLPLDAPGLKMASLPEIEDLREENLIPPAPEDGLSHFMIVNNEWV